MLIKYGCVTLRAIEERDFDILYKMMQSADIEKSMGHCTLPISEKQQQDWMSKYQNTDEQIRLMIELENGKTIGVVMLFDIDLKNGTAEFGHKLCAASEDRIKGDIIDADKAILDYAFNNLRLNCVTARAVADNEKAVKALTRVGFVEEGILRQRIYQDGQYLDLKSFSVLRTDFIK